MRDHYLRQQSVRPIPARALLLSGAALLVPVLAATAFRTSVGPDGVLLWLTALVPAFLLAYYRGWRGAAAALAAGMAVLSVTHVAIVYFGLPTPDWSLLAGVVVAYVIICLGIGWLSEILHRERLLAQEIALTDPLTELPNRRHATLVLEGEFAAAERGRELAVILFDFDGFKAYNDRHGHAAGDQALRTFGRILASSTRRMNLSARYGGEEFISILSDCDADGAVAFAERIRGEMSDAELEGEPITVSAGVAVYRRGLRSPEVLVSAADRALYMAKRDGRDRVRVAPLDGAAG